MPIGFSPYLALLANLPFEAASRHPHGERFSLHFKPLRNASALAFPCDASGLVELDRLTDRERNNYLFARASCGRDYGRPQVLALEVRTRLSERGIQGAALQTMAVSH